ncbi:hypothetical protein V6N13_044142 [Hibiscus sabdariffa]|uniref:Uncharacterized protein n=1 Tax=Hibiscus sabdariffa TaxID=183260 RepID=A0ABR2RH96_9ROSI
MVKPVRQKNTVLLAFRVSPPIHPDIKRISRPRVALVPREVRRLAWSGSFEGTEPVSPRVSCTGHIDCQIKKTRGASLRKPKQASSPLAQALAEQIKRKVLSVRKHGYEPDALVASETSPSLQHTRQFDVFYLEADQSAPSLQQMRQICMGRSTLSGRDRRAYDAEENDGYEFHVSNVQAASEAADIVAPSLQQMKQFCNGRSRLSDFDWIKRGHESDAPSLQEMRQFCKGRSSTLSEFDGRAGADDADAKEKEKGEKRKRS